MYPPMRARAWWCCIRYWASVRSIHWCYGLLALIACFLRQKATEYHHLSTSQAAQLPQQDRLLVNADAEQRIRLLAQVAPTVEARLAVQLVRGDVEVPIHGSRKRVGPQEARVVRDSLP